MLNGNCNYDNLPTYYSTSGLSKDATISRRRPVTRCLETNFDGLGLSFEGCGLSFDVSGLGLTTVQDTLKSDGHHYRKYKQFLIKHA